MTLTPRDRVIGVELDSAATNYAEARVELETARTRFEIAKQRLNTVRELSRDIMNGTTYWNIMGKHPDVAYAGATLGDAVNRVLRNFGYGAFYSIYEELDKLKKFEVPYMHLAQIVAALDKGGFDFTSAYPTREVNAALIHLAGIEKRPKGLPGYRSTEAVEYITMELGDRITEMEPTPFLDALNEAK